MDQIAAALQALNDKVDNLTAIAQQEFQYFNGDRSEQILHSIRGEPPSFVGDPKEYCNWEADMDYYFEWSDMSEVGKTRFTKNRLLGQARMYWNHVETMAMYRRHEPIRTWIEMKDTLRNKYVPPSYHQYRPIQNYERFSRLPITHQPESLGLPKMNHSLASPPSHIGKGVKEKTSRKCILCNGLDHTVGQCPLLIGKSRNEDLEHDPEEEIPEEEVYVANPELADIYEKYDSIQTETTLEEQLVVSEEQLEEDRCVLSPPNDNKDGDKAAKQDNTENNENDSCIKTLITDTVTHLDSVKADSNILERPDLFNHDQSNTCTIMSQGQEITIYPSPSPVYRSSSPVYMVVDEFSYPKTEFSRSKTYNAIKVYQYFEEIVRMHRIMLDKCIRFNSYFRKTLWNLLGTKLVFSSAYHKSLGRFLVWQSSM